MPAAIRDDLDHYRTETDPAEVEKLGFSRSIARRAVPTLVMVGRCLDGDTFTQIKPLTPIKIIDKKGGERTAKALFPAGGGGRMHVAKGKSSMSTIPQSQCLSVRASSRVIRKQVGRSGSAQRQLRRRIWLSRAE